MFASVSIDLDGLDLYHRIHALPEPTHGNPIYTVAVPRFLELFDELGIQATFFVVTRYLEDAAALAPLVAGATAGHEMGSHTHNHPYNLIALDEAALANEIDRAHERITTLLGAPPEGFRAPGYNIGDGILNVLEARGYLYDSSVFPCPPYYLAKGAIMAGMRLLGRPSGSSMTDPRGLLAPIGPYQPDESHFYRRGRRGRARRIWEIPMCVMPALRFPIIGTTLALMGPRGFAALYPVLRRTQPWLNLEFHGIDLLDASDLGVDPALLVVQPDLRRSVTEKRRTYRDALARIAADYPFGTLKAMVAAL